MPRVNINEKLVVKNSELSCLFCGGIYKASTGFYPSSSRNSMLRADDKGITRLIICKDCAQNFFNYLHKIFRKLDRTIFNFCAALDVYYDPEAVKQIQTQKVDSEKVIDEYFKRIKSSTASRDKTFADSKGFAIEEDKESIHANYENGLTESDLANRREILSVFHRDPFEDMPIEVRKQLYQDLITMVDPAMADDLVRQRAAIEIVRSFYRVSDIQRSINELSKDPQSSVRNAKEIKALTEIKTKETDMITKFSKDHGFAERYATAKSRGAGTLSATIRDMEDYDYDDGKINAYDIKTSATMQQAADISTQAIMKQLSLSEADYVDMLKQQRERLVRLEQDNMRYREELRLVYKQIVKQDLLKELATELAQKGMSTDEVFASIMSEIHFDEKTLVKYNKELQKEEERKKKEAGLLDSEEEDV